jgi:hypothetical protein
MMIMKMMNSRLKPPFLSRDKEVLLLEHLMRKQPLELPGPNSLS